jgi:hypothetical protein
MWTELAVEEAAECRSTEVVVVVVTAAEVMLSVASHL